MPLNHQVTKIHQKDDRTIVEIQTHALLVGRYMARHLAGSLFFIG
jgi:hypothetical protein